MTDTSDTTTITCELCDESINASGLIVHLRGNHPNSPNSIKKHYPELYDEVVGHNTVDQIENTVSKKGRPDEDGGIPGRPDMDGASSEESDEAEESPEELDKVNSNSTNQNSPKSTKVDPDKETDEETPTDAQGFEKWYMIGVGGGGGNLVDAILLRQKTLENKNHPVAAAWSGGVREAVCLNTNVDAELSGTYFADEYTTGSVVDASDRYEIGPPTAEGAGRVEEKGDWLMRKELVDDNDDDTNQNLMQLDDSEILDNDLASGFGPLFNTDSMEDSQGVLIFHTAVKGTGSGSTPLLAKWIREEGSGDSQNNSLFTEGQSLFSGMILPRGETKDEQLKTNGLVGMARMAESVDAIIPFDNQRIRNLDNDIGVAIEGTKNYNLDEYMVENEKIVAWLEGATLSSIPQDAANQANIGAGDFDVEDMYSPAEAMRPREYDSSSSAVIIAPAYGRVDMSSYSNFNMSALQGLLTNTINGGKMVDFDHDTAWGGSFVILRPEEYENEIKGFENTLEKILRSKDFLNVNNDNIPAPIAIYQVTVPGISDVYMWAGFWNPELPRLRDWYNWGQQYKDSQLGTYARIGDNWDTIEELFTLMGRESLQEFV